MTRDDILRWARSAIRLSADDASLTGFDREATILDRYEFLHWFAKEAAVAEREKCAQLIETYEKAGNMVGAPHFVMVLKDCAAAIRARSNVQQEPQK